MFLWREVERVGAAQHGAGEAQGDSIHAHKSLQGGARGQRQCPESGP